MYVCIYLCIKEICQLVKWIPVTAEESCPWIFSYHNWQGTFFQFYSTKVRVMPEQAIPIFGLPKAPAKQLFSQDLVRELWETMKVQDVSNSQSIWKRDLESRLLLSCRRHHNIGKRRRTWWRGCPNVKFKFISRLFFRPIWLPLGL